MTITFYAAYQSIRLGGALAFRAPDVVQLTAGDAINGDDTPPIIDSHLGMAITPSMLMIQH